MDRRGDRWSDRRWTRLGAAVAGLALIGSGLATTQARAEVDPPSGPSVPAGFTHTTAIGGIAQPVAVAFAPDGTAFIGLQIGLIKSYDYDAETGEWEPFETSTEFADLTEQVNNYSDRGLTGIAVDPEFPDRPYVYVNYTLNKDPSTGAYPAWGDGGEYDDCGVGGADEANIAKPGAPEYRRGCPVMDRVSRLTAVREELGWVMTEEVVLVEDGCAQFASHSSGDVTFGPDGMLYASAGEGASFREADYGQANGRLRRRTGVPGRSGQRRRFDAGAGLPHHGRPRYRPARHRRHDLPARPGCSPGPGDR